MANTGGRRGLIRNMRKRVGRDPSDWLLDLVDKHHDLLGKVLASKVFNTYREKFRMDKETEQFWAVRWLVENRLIFLLEEIMGMDWLGDFHKHPETGMLRLYEKAQSCGKYNRILNMWPRGFGKSTYLTVGANIQRVLKNPEIRIGIGSWRVDLAERFIFQISEELMGNDFLRELYPDVIWENPKKSPRWTVQKGLQVMRESRDKDPTLMPFSIFNLPTGSHVNMIFLDDIVTLDNASSEVMQASVKGALKQISNLLTRHEEPIHWTGTTYTFNDAVTKAQDDPTWLILRRNCWADGKRWKQASYPERFPVKSLKAKYEEDGPYSFAANMELTPVLDQDRTLRSEWLTEVSNVPKNLDLYMGIDLAFTSGTRSDRTAITVGGITPARNKLYLVDGLVLKSGIEESIEYIISMAKKYNNRIVMCGIEMISGAQGIEPMVRRALADSNVVLPLKIIKGYSRAVASKNVRIESYLAPMMSAGNIVITKNFRDCHLDMPLQPFNELVKEIDMFRFNGHDDILDSIVNLLIIMPRLGNSKYTSKGNLKKNVDRRDFLNSLLSKGRRVPKKSVRRWLAGHER